MQEVGELIVRVCLKFETNPPVVLACLREQPLTSLLWACTVQSHVWVLLISGSTPKSSVPAAHQALGA